VVDSGGVHRYTVLVKAHVADCGNAAPTSYNPGARDVYEEGALIFPCVKIQEDYEYQADVIRMCEMRIRVPEQWRGDNRAMIGAARVGENEVLALGDDLGWERLAQAAQQWFDYSEGRIDAALRRMPGGEVTVETCHDPFPGVPDGVRLRVTLRVDPTIGVAEVDLRENPDCVPCGLNLTEATSRTAAMVGVLNSLTEAVPSNAGSHRRIRVLLRENCVAGVPRHPASCSLATTGIADRVANAVQRAAAELGPEIGMAEAGLCTPPASGVVSGRDPRRRGEPFVNQLILGMTGGPGGPSADGWLNLAHVGNAGLMLRDSTEVDELRHPVRIWTDAIVPDSEGAGAHRGAPSGKVEFGPVNCALEVMWASDGNVHPAAGVRGGQDGAPARQFKRERSGALVELPSTGRLTLVDPETIVSVSCGGGGYGDPRTRKVRAVAHDVSEGWITPQRARSVYGVVADALANIDSEATHELRQSLTAPDGNTTRDES